MTDHRPLFIATTAGFTALKASVSVAARVLEALVITGTINREAAVALLEEIERDARASAAEAAELAPVLDVHFRTARQVLLAAKPLR